MNTSNARDAAISRQFRVQALSKHIFFELDLAIVEQYTKVPAATVGMRLILSCIRRCHHV